MGARHRLGRPTDRARALRNGATDAEQTLWNRLRRTQLDGLKFSRQIPIGPYICDFICRSHKLVVELDGSQHQEQVSYDEARTRRLEAEGYRVIRFWNNDVSGNLAGVLETILTAALDGERAPTPLPPPACGRGSPA